MVYIKEWNKDINYLIFMIYYPLGEKMMAKVSSSLKEQRSEAEMEEA